MNQKVNMWIKVSWIAFLNFNYIQITIEIQSSEVRYAAVSNIFLGMDGARKTVCLIIMPLLKGRNDISYNDDCKKQRHQKQSNNSHHEPKGNNAGAGLRFFLYSRWGICKPCVMAAHNTGIGPNPVE